MAVCNWSTSSDIGGEESFVLVDSGQVVDQLVMCSGGEIRNMSNFLARTPRSAEEMVGAC